MATIDTQKHLLAFFILMKLHILIQPASYSSAFIIIRTATFLCKLLTTLKTIHIKVAHITTNFTEVFSDNLEDAFISAYKNVQNDENQKIKHVYICLGIYEFKRQCSAKYKQYFEALFKEVSKCKNNTFLFFDDSDKYKQIQVEPWYKDNINNTFGIWLGEDIGLQVALGVMSLSMEDRQNLFPCIGYPIYQGKHMVIKYVIDGVDREDE